MKKLKSLLVVFCLSVFVFSCATQCFTIQAVEKTNSVTLLDLVRLKKYLAGIPVDIENADYNKDNKVDSRDLVYLINLLMDSSSAPTVPDNNTENPKLDDDGYYNEVVKP